MKRLDELLQLLFDDQLTAGQTEELNALLKISPEARADYRRSLRLHAALIRHRQEAAGLPAHSSIIPFKPAAILAAAACLLAGLFIAFSNQPAAKLTGSTAAVWKNGSSELQGPTDLVSGFAELTFRNGVKVILEGPCRFQVTSRTSMKVTHGRATVKVPQEIDGFHLDTPAGRITDLGTEFGVAVGSGSEGPVILTEVFDGEIEIPAEETPRKRLLSGESLAIVRETGITRLISTLGDYRVNLADSARRLPSKSGISPESGNLALGKPVSSPAYYNQPHGAVFPADNLTDGRLNDTGSPGDWSFWLAPNDQSGEFTVDLLDSVKIGRIDIQNTRNRTHGDRGMRDIRVQVSADGVDFREIFTAELKSIPLLPPPGVDFPFESFTFPSEKARYVRVLAHSHYRHPERPPENPNHGGGLNEIRIFAP